MLNLSSIFRRSLWLAGFSLATSLASLHAQPAPAAAPTTDAGKSIIANSSMELDGDGDQWPDGWPKLKAGGSWENEEGNRFIRMTSPSPGAMVMLYREIPIPAGVEALELTWRQRVTGLKRGKQPYFDARVMLEFMDADRGKIGPGPKPVATGKDTISWVEKSTQFIVPPGAHILKFMPALFNVEAGTFDLDDVVLKPTAAAPLKAAADEATAAKAAKLAADTNARQAKVASSLTAGGALITNGDFEKPNKAGDFAADWPKSGTWGTDADGNRFLRLQTTESGKTAMVFRSLTLPAGVQAFELSFRWRITDLKPGDMPWFDARIMLDVKDAAGNKLKPQPSPPYSRKNTADGAWAERTTSFLVPEGGVTLDLMPSLFQVQAGTLDIDDIVLKPTDPVAIVAKQKEHEAVVAKSRVPTEETNKANWPAELRAEGNRLVTVKGGKELWLQGLNVPSLEWSLTGEQVLKSTVVGIEQWKGNVIRLPVKEEYWFGRKGQTDGGKAYRDVVDQVITLASNRGAYVVLDLHRYRAPKQEYLEFWTDAATRYKTTPPSSSIS
jgi:endoglucanase